MMLTVEDFPLKALGALVYARTRSSPVFTAMTPEMARQLVTVMNGRAVDERPYANFKEWLVIH